MRSPKYNAGIKLIIGMLLFGGAVYEVKHSNFYFLFIPNILLLLGLALFSEAILSLLCSVSKKLVNQKAEIILTSRATFIMLFIADLIIRFIGIAQTYSERADGNYYSIAAQEKLSSWYWVHTPNTTVYNPKKEFEFKRFVNSLGLSEKEIDKNKGSGLRILAIGDSFTEGIGVDYEGTWVKQMETRWKSQRVQTINAGIGGSDPVYEFALYRDKLTPYKPDIVVLTINSTDIGDIVGRGGYERFHADGTAGKKAPWWEGIYASNHLFRMIMRVAFKYNFSLIKNADSEEKKHNAVKIIKETIVKFRDLTRKEDSKLLIVLQPSITEFDNGRHTPFFGQLEIAKFLETEGIHYLDASIEFRKKGKSVPDYYYPLDTHFNKQGYELFGKTTYEKLEALGFLK